MRDYSELVPQECVESGKYKLTFKNGNIEERWIMASKAYLMLNNLREYDLTKMELIVKSPTAE